MADGRDGGGDVSTEMAASVLGRRGQRGSGQGCCLINEMLSCLQMLKVLGDAGLNPFIKRWTHTQERGKSPLISHIFIPAGPSHFSF